MEKEISNFSKKYDRLNTQVSQLSSIDKEDAKQETKFIQKEKDRTTTALRLNELTSSTTDSYLPILLDILLVLGGLGVAVIAYRKFQGGSYPVEY